MTCPWIDEASRGGARVTMRAGDRRQAAHVKDGIGARDRRKRCAWSSVPAGHACRSCRFETEGEAEDER